MVRYVTRFYKRVGLELKRINFITSAKIGVRSFPATAYFSSFILKQELWSRAVFHLFKKSSKLITKAPSRSLV